jgi:predicted dehydrogenase
VVKLINVGIIGLGKMGLLHAGIFNALENSKVTAIAEKNKFIVSALKNHIPKINMYTDYEKMFRKEDLDALVITTPVFLHKEMVLDAEDYGVHIFVEKPLAINGDECRSILDRKTEQKTTVGYCRRFIETYRLVKKLIDESVLGPVNFFQSQIFVEQVLQKENGWFYDPKKSGGGVLMDLGSHALDLSHYFFGDLNTVRAVGKEIYSESVEDYASLVMKFKNGILGSLQASWSMRNYRLPETKFNIQFENGMVTVTEKYVEIYSDVKNEMLKKGWNTFYKQNLTKNVPVDIGGTEYTAEDQHFLECINSDCESLCNFKEAAKTNFVIDNSYSSIQDGKTKKVKYGV